MEKYTYVFCICIVVIIVLLVLYFRSQSARKDSLRDYKKFLEGFWVADGGFCEESDISSMLLFIGEVYDKCHHKAYLVINNNITKQALVLKIKNESLKYDDGAIPSYRADLEIEFEEPCDIPEKIKLTADMKTGCLKLHDDDTIYGLFFKENEISSMLVGK